VNITDLEFAFLKEMAGSDFAYHDDNSVLCGYIHSDEHNMTVVRGVISSLIQKKYISFTPSEYGCPPWICSDNDEINAAFENVWTVA
jgi:hypothetical protein